MTLLSVNINKIALIRNSRGSDKPNLLTVAQNCINFGAQGITVHPRPDQRHIKYSDLDVLKQNINVPLNVEGYPDEVFMNYVIEVQPKMVTLVPDKPDALTSSNGWDTITAQKKLINVCTQLANKGISTSIFIDPVEKMAIAAKDCGADYVELYTEFYANAFETGNEIEVIGRYIKTTESALKLGLKVNAGHDLNSHNLKFLKKNIPDLSEVSIGHALVIDALYLGLESTIKKYLECLN
ncbi:MAG: pyridoxine 5'-phosphate synthase [Bacteroidota bacterium]|nr:pyridoxine 5'-phosphate synthase [Bacteroidota bacterium]